MIQVFRKLFQSKFGMAAALGFIGLIAIAFASADITGVGFGGVAGGDRAATVGSERISTAALRTTVQSNYEQARQQDPTLTYEKFFADGAMDDVLAEMIARYAVYDMAKETGIHLSEALIGSEIAAIPAFQGADGRFSDQVFRQALAQAGLTEKLLREDVEQTLSERMLIQPATLGARLPEKIVKRYARLFNERRIGSIGLLPSAAFAPASAANDAALQKYLAANRDRYALPERRTIRWATFGAEAVADVTATEAEIAARYERDAEQYEGRESRRLTQLVVPTQAAARAVLDEIEGGTSIAAAAASKGLSTTAVTAESRAAFETASSRAVAEAVYAGGNGDIVGPVRGPLGWYLLRIDGVTRSETRPLSAVRGQIAEAVTAEKRRSALADLAAEAEAQLNDGSSLAEVAEALGIDVQTSGPVMENGAAFGPGQALPEILRPVVSTVFAMDEDSDAQIAVSRDGQTYMLFAPGRITESAPPAFAEIRPQLAADYARDRGKAAAEKAAATVLKAVAGGRSLGEAMAALGKDLPPVDNVNLSRQQLMAGPQVPEPLALMFTMASGSAKSLEAPQDFGFFLVVLDEIETTAPDPQDPLLAAASQELARLRAQEYAISLRRAIGDATETSRNESAIAAIAEQLGGNR